MDSSVLVISTDPQGSAVWWADRVKALPFAFDQAHEDLDSIGKLPSLGARIHVVCNQKGGVGKTTVAVNLAATVAEAIGPDGRLQHVFIDTPGNLEDANILATVLDICHDVIIPIPPEALSFDATQRTIEEMVQPRDLPYRVVVNDWDPRDGKVDRDETISFIDLNGWPRARTVVRHYKLHTRAAAEGRVVTQYERNRVALEARSDFAQLALELGYGPVA